jgi:tripartite-type tricarboxylate transporter receptor subunit TctC
MAVHTDEGGAEMRVREKSLRVVAAFLALGAIVLMLAHDVYAQQKYPSRPIQLIIPYPPGGSDALSRKVYATMSKNIGQEMVIMNVPGASTQVASRKVAESAPDGYTLYISSPPELVAGPALYEKLPFDPLRDFTPISFQAQLPYILLVSTKLPVKNYTEFISYAKTHVADVRLGSYGALSQTDVIARRFRKATGIDFQIIPYNGGSPSFNALMANEIQGLFATPIPTRPFIKDGKMLPLAVTAATRAKLFPDVPTLKEVGIDVVDYASYGLAGPKGLPRNIVDFLQRELVKAMNEPETRSFVEAMGAEIVAGTPEEFEKWLKDNTKLWADFVPTLGIEKMK